MGWADESMQDAIELLARMGRNDIASDLNRLLGALDFDDLEVLRCSNADKVASRILEAPSLADLSALVSELSSVFHVKHTTINVISEAAFTNFTTKVVTTYPDAWISRYVDRRYSLLDPVSKACRTQDRGFFWHALDESSLSQRSFWADSIAHGIGPSGYTQPIVTERGDRLAVSFCSDEDTNSFYQRMVRHESDLFSIGIYLSDTFCRLASEDRPSQFHPTDDQLMVLRAISTGAEEADLERLIYQYGSFPTMKRSVCELFRTKTLAQAAVIAARVGLLVDAPLTKADILAASGQRIVAPDQEPILAAPLRRLARMRHPGHEGEVVTGAVIPIAKQSKG